MPIARIYHQKAAKAGLLEKTGGTPYDYNDRKARPFPVYAYSADVDDETLKELQAAGAVAWVNGEGEPSADDTPAVEDRLAQLEALVAQHGIDTSAKTEAGLEKALEKAGVASEE